MKASVHGVALATAAVCGGYNIAAWLVRRERHLAINVLFYSAAVMFEIVHVRHHIAAVTPTQTALTAVLGQMDDAA
jgi:hypothetical protein